MTDEKLLKKLGERINQLRQEQEMPFQDLVHKTGIDKGNLVKLTSTGSNITLTTFLKISRGLNTPIADFFDFEYGIKNMG
ncbi:hypothetical protein MYP_4478 [Sporocytophaga myxococcoides]|uniref:HTH cro/C1-type domain-containing protein n=1 Tax=Sporocytophaga myxococcoides TaxID=153721 RepID=A0A098LMJ9_9BACT|nr:helix-turn-helix transcriptional regulator [Sporocytophaga myxococcoides]GAL87248.1 hypothetical protein MYP_4478 [Sporocytophaga myxococcoides]